MSVTIEFVFNSNADFKEVGQQVRSSLGANLEPYFGDDNDLFAHFLGLEMSLWVGDLENDRDMDFSSYRYHLCTRTAEPAAERLAYQLEATALVAYVLLSGGVARDGMLVYDAQRLLARYQPRPDGHVYDAVSGVVVVFPGHMEALRARWPRAH